MDDGMTSHTELRALAAGGVSSAQYNLGRWYESRRNDDPDYSKALMWYRLAAAQGNALAQHDLGLMYFKGLGVAANMVTARMWFAMAARSGVSDAIGS